MGYLRYVAVGDSQTEGLNDGDEVAGYRGWADRLAELLAAGEPEFRYANLAVRGRLAGQIRAEQLGAALALEPDLVTVMAGMNDLVRPGFDASAVTANLEAMFAAFARPGVQVVTFTFPDVARIAPLVRHLRPRVIDFNERIRETAGRHGVLVVDTFGDGITVDPRLWSADRIHATPLGHARIAAAVADALGLPGSDASWGDPLPPLRPTPIWSRVGRELAWAGSVLGPWVLRRLRGRSSGDGRVAKRPDLLPMFRV
ncbi:SGNH/GDSL hydrolase family protein [Planotetraspora sp. A-T 1434]|uniref:SGNH/GDSL hydrolase family protein n=1 Tax=Planotetraspora sp. A-T 1434 TaxID=2979219 RepID=UPI0021BE99FA|nr:SGNH/GDSL hydrolase family protein [Planotetraspora sp. A-T 1434]MCT9929841.1 SGNH/GDSL hydrolase family protein [Planotetraspora sp. A-T 1434]